MSPDHPSPALVALLEAVQRDALSAGDRQTLVRALRAASQGRSIDAIVEGGRRERRDELLRGMRRIHFADMTASGAAKAMARCLAAYEVGPWSSDRSRATPPAEGTIDRAAFELLMLGPAPAWRTILRSLP